ncbi:MAG: ATPase [Bacteroidales bacterium]|nr:ATPase [Bacteroidales bacterium]
MQLNINRKFAIPVKDGILDSHFGHCKQYAIIETDNQNIVSESIIDAPPHEPGLLPVWLSEKGITDVLAGGMGAKASEIFKKHNVAVFVGAPILSAKDLVTGYLNNTISFTENHCDH